MLRGGCQRGLQALPGFFATRHAEAQKAWPVAEAADQDACAAHVIEQRFGLAGTDEAIERCAASRGLADGSR